MAVPTEILICCISNLFPVKPGMAPVSCVAKAMAVRLLTTISLPAALNGTLAGHVGQFFNPFVDESVAGDPSRAFYNGADFQDPGKLASGRRCIHSTFGEVDIPILGQKWSWPGLRNLDVTLSERYDQYSDFSAAKPKFAIRYKPFNDLTFRATYSEGFSAPSLATQSDDSSTFR